SPTHLLEVNGTGFFGGNLTVGTTSAVATISSPGSGTSSEHFGAGSAAPGAFSLAVGNSANATQYTTALGFGANNTGNFGVTIGTSAATSATYGIGIGYSNTVSNSGSIVIGNAQSDTAANQLVIGTSVNGYQINDVYIGSGVTTTIPHNLTINGSGASGSNILGSNVTFAPGNGTGTGGSGALIFQTAPAGSTGSSADTLAERMRIDQNGNVGIGTTSPGNALQVGGGSGLSSAFTISGYNASDASVALKNTSFNNVAFLDATSNLGIVGSFTNTPFAI